MRKRLKDQSIQGWKRRTLLASIENNLKTIEMFEGELKEGQLPEDY
jgi:hypothetical protein